MPNLPVSHFYDPYLNPSTREGAIFLGILAGVILLGFQKIATWMQIAASNLMLFNLSRNYSLDGYWLSVEDKDGDLVVLNYNKIIQRKSRVQFYVWQYNMEVNHVEYYRYYAEGIMKGNHLSAFFYSGDSSKPETGALTFKLDGSKLVGKYIQFSVDLENAELIESPADYYLRRIILPQKCKLRMLVGKSPFKTKAEAFSHANELRTTRRRRQSSATV